MNTLTIFENKKYLCYIVQEQDKRYHVYLKQKYNEFLGIVEHSSFTLAEHAKAYAESFKGVYHWSV